MSQLEIPHFFHRIEMALARHGDTSALDHPHPYCLIAPLDADGRLDYEAWSKNQGACRVVRGRRDRRDDEGHLVRTPFGVWAFRYDISSEPGDVGVRPIQTDRITQGATVRLNEEDGEHVLQIVSISPLQPQTQPAA